MSLKPVQDLSVAALDGIGQFKELDYGFYTSCIEDCTFSKVTEIEIERELNCSCEPYQQADDQVYHMFLALIDYWDGLYQLSSMDINQYNLSRPTAALGTSNLIQLNEEHLLAFQKLSEISLKAVTGQYRKNKIKTYMAEADTYQQIISNKLTFVLKENLKGLLAIQEEGWYAYYRTLTYDPTLNTVDKALAADKYYKLLENNKSRNDQITVLIEVIDLIAQKHHQLVEAGTKSNSASFKEEVGRISKDLHTLHYAFEQLKK
ncbi:hypothetical protein [uncultured Cyclobacterium sp.]|uniref:hypothetical protein n=1 Tax=uncultured Cyclobacterium sp. TaxID=453820 RepID=UPI0030EF1364|tara:strand:- start:563396 stop:564181 length:786 start_codon:yes stop_codon:yes gene_type:complete